MAIGIEFNGTDLTIGSNGFSTTNRYIRQVANAADGRMWMVEGPSINIAAGTSSFVFRFEIGNLVYAHTGAPAAFAIDRLIAV